MQGGILMHFKKKLWYFLSILSTLLLVVLPISGCNSSFNIPKEKGKAIERGEDIEISYWDLKDNNINNNYLKKRCQKCNRELEKDFEYCPYCGEKIK